MKKQGKYVVTFVLILGLLIQSSSWGEKLYIEYSDIYDYLERYSSAETDTDIIYIK